MPNYKKLNYWFNTQIIAFPVNKIMHMVYVDSKENALVWEKDINSDFHIHLNNKKNEIKSISEKNELKKIPALFNNLTFSAKFNLTQVKNINFLHPNLFILFDTNEQLDYFFFFKQEQAYVKLKYSQGKPLTKKSIFSSQQIKQIENNLFLLEKEQLTLIKSNLKDYLL